MSGLSIDLAPHLRIARPVRDLAASRDFWLAAGMDEQFSKPAGEGYPATLGGARAAADPVLGRIADLPTVRSKAPQGSAWDEAVHLARLLGVTADVLVSAAQRPDFTEEHARAALTQVTSAIGAVSRISAAAGATTATQANVDTSIRLDEPSHATTTWSGPAGTSAGRVSDPSSEWPLRRRAWPVRSLDGAPPPRPH